MFHLLPWQFSLSFMHITTKIFFKHFLQSLVESMYRVSSYFMKEFPLKSNCTLRGMERILLMVDPRAIQTFCVLKSSYLTNVLFKQNVFFSRTVVCTSLNPLLRSLINLPENLGKLVYLIFFNQLFN